MRHKIVRFIKKLLYPKAYVAGLGSAIIIEDKTLIDNEWQPNVQYPKGKDIYRGVV